MPLRKKESIYNINKDELKSWMKVQDLSLAKLDRIWAYLYRDKLSSFDEMEELGPKIQEALKKYYYMDPMKIVEEYQAEDGTIKFLFQLDDGNMVETVLMKHKYGRTVCVSSQLGCNMGCKFCASGQLKKLRNLTTAEILVQVIQAGRRLEELSKQEGKKEEISHIVVMGIGEPFDNYENILAFLATAMDDKGMAIAPRKITVSTCGLVPRIRDFANANTKAKLAISLHGASDEVRNELMPINRKYDLASLYEAMRFYIDQTKQRISLEYIMIEGLTDRKEDAQALVQSLKPFGKKVMVNLIPYNQVEGLSYKTSSSENIDLFYRSLTSKGIFTFRRREHGGEVDAACGQLRSRQLK